MERRNKGDNFDKFEALIKNSFENKSNSYLKEANSSGEIYPGNTNNILTNSLIHNE